MSPQPRRRIPAHAIGRLTASTTLVSAKRMQERRQSDAEMGLREIDQEFQIGVSGVATPVLGADLFEVEFDYFIAYAPGQRDSDLDHPQMTFGAECDANVMIGAHVRAWRTDEDTGMFIGALVCVTVIGADGATPYRGVLHVTFSGLGLPIEEEGAT